MSIVGFGFYIVIWWIVFLAVLPLGVRNHDEAGVETSPGVERAAPHAPKLWMKAALAAGIAAVIWLIVFAAFAMGLLKIVPD
ncbi:MAG: DUF1467 family protein [Caulobacterales bacterium]